jgi:hypothetical protein
LTPSHGFASCQAALSAFCRSAKSWRCSRSDSAANEAAATRTAIALPRSKIRSPSSVRL